MGWGDEVKGLFGAQMLEVVVGYVYLVVLKVGKEHWVQKLLRSTDVALVYIGGLSAYTRILNDIKPMSTENIQTNNTL